MPRTRIPGPPLGEAGLRPTRTREAVLEALLEAGTSLSHAELAARLPSHDKVTVYRSLKALRSSGLLHGVLSLDGVLRYVAHRGEGGPCPGGHAHFLCLGCGSMTCLNDTAMPRVELPAGFRVRGKQFLVYGLCPSCEVGTRAARPSTASASDAVASAAAGAAGPAPTERGLANPAPTERGLANPAPTERGLAR